MKKRVPFTYRLIPSPLGEVGIVWRNDSGRVLVRSILLPRKGHSMSELIREAFPDVAPETGGVDTICQKIGSLLGGDAVRFEIGDLDFHCVGGFSRRVLIADFKIPRGKVMTYGGLAARVGVPGGARAVGNVMAENPFPLVIPCHRVIRSDGSLGGFGGGLPMKRALLEMEGVRFDGAGRVYIGCIRI
jgi:methylated-DNA-[protein]-cysteine S-methyltransferase